MMSITPKGSAKQLVCLSIALLSFLTTRAQEAPGPYAKNIDAYKIKPVKYNSKKNDYCAVKFFDAVVFTSGRESKNKKMSSRMAEKHVHLYTTEKKADGNYLKPKIFLPDLQTRYNDGPVCFNKEGTMIFFSRNHIGKTKPAKDGEYKYKLFQSGLNRSGLDSVIQFPFNSDAYNVMHPAISPDGNTIYFASDMPGGKGGYDIYLSKKTGNAWGSPVNLGEKVNTSGSEMFPFIAYNGMLYFSSDGHKGMGGLDIFESKVVDNVGKKAYNMGEPVNSKNDDFGYFLYSDNKSGYLSSNRKRAGKEDNIYDLEVLREVKRGKDAHIVVKDKATGAPMANSTVFINEETFTTNENGEYLLTVEDEVDYTVAVQQIDYLPSMDKISSEGITEDEFTRIISMDKDAKLSLVGIITDAQSGQAVGGVSIKIKDLATNKDFDNTTTNASGTYNKPVENKKVGDKVSYSIVLDKPGYLQKTVTVDYKVIKPGALNINDVANLSIGKVAVGMDLAKMIDIKPIYFDLGKTTIRPDAAIELDKIVAIMTEYPNMSIELGSHTDCRSGAASNLKLSATRAKASASYIVKKGIAASRITGKGYGETKLLNNCACEGAKNSNCSEDEHMKNRRTEFLITRMK